MASNNNRLDISSQKVEPDFADAVGVLEQLKKALEAGSSKTVVKKTQWEATKEGLGAELKQIKAAEVQTLGAELKKNDEEIQSLESKLKGKDAAVESLGVELKGKNAEVKRLRKKVKELEQQLKKCNTDNKTVADEKTKLEEEVKKLGKQGERSSGMSGRPNPKVFLDMEQSGSPIGRIVIELYADTTPLTAENFRALCTGEKGQPRFFKGSKIMRDYCSKSVYVTGGISPYSIYGRMYPAENFIRRHTGPGTVSIICLELRAGSRFIISTRKLDEFDAKYVVVGQVVEGMDVVYKVVNSSSVISDCGQLP